MTGIIIKILKKYILPIFTVFLFFIFIGLIFSYAHNGLIGTLKILGICTVISIFISVIVGAGNYYRYEIWLKKTQESILNESPFKEMLDNHFEQGDGYVSKIIQGYNVSVGLQINPRLIIVKVHFSQVNNSSTYNNKQLDQLIKPYDTHKWYQNRSLLWGKDILINQLFFVFKMPSYELVMQRVNESIIVLRDIGAKP